MIKDNNSPGKKDDPIWKGFHGQPLDDTHLKGRALAFAPPLVGYADENSTFLMENYFPAVHPNVLFWETVILILHLVDRISFDVLGDEKRKWFMDPLVMDIAERFAETTEEDADKEEMKKHFFAHYNGRFQEYMTCKITTSRKEEGGSGIRNTLGWKFADILNDGEVSEANSAMPLIVAKIYAGLLDVLHLKGLLKG